nr:hypothetical protein [Gammaproteobacteria bacterium]
MSTRLLSATAEPTITRSRYAAGGDVTPYSSGQSGGRRSPSVRSISPLRPNSSQRCPSRRSRQTRRPSTVPM